MPKGFFNLVSIIFHPVFIPLYLALLLYRELHIKAGSVPMPQSYIIAFVGCTVIPVILILLLRIVKLISSLRLDERKERFLPFALSIISVYFTLYVLRIYYGEVLLSIYLLGIILALLLAIIANFFFKISIHSIAAGALLASVFTMYSSPLTTSFELIIITCLVAGLILSSRLYLKAHNNFQIWSGFFYRNSFNFICIRCLWCIRRY